MAGFLKLKVNDRELATIRQGASAVRDFRKPMRQFLSFLETETKQQFVTQSAPDGTRWKDLSPKTWAYKKSKSILREKAIMVNSLYTKLLEAGGEIGFSAEHTIYHQEGTENTPQRKVLDITEERLSKGAAIFEIYYGDLLGAE